MMDRTHAQAMRLEAGGYMQPANRPNCANCTSSQRGAHHQAAHCSRHDAPVAAQGLCSSHTPDATATIRPLIASRNVGRPDRDIKIALQLAARDDGITSSDFAQATGAAVKYASTRLRRIAERGALWPAKALPAPTHWFLTEERAAQWLNHKGRALSGLAAQDRRSCAGKRPKREPKPGIELLAKPKASKPATVSGNTTGHKPAGQATNPNNVQPTYGRHYTHDVRRQCAPGEQPYGAGFAAALPGIDPLTGQAWERRA
jgi:hypothetical protein